MTEKWVILDRDGVINYDSDNFIKSPKEWKPIEGSLEAIALLNNCNFRVVVATNQSGLARGLFDKTDLDKIHQKMHHLVQQAGGKIEAVFFCPHGPNDQCSCRKPLPGLLFDFASKFSIDLKGVPLVGDSYRDLEAGMAVGAKPILVKTGKGLKTLQDPRLSPSVAVYENLADFVNQFLEKK